MEQHRAFLLPGRKTLPFYISLTKMELMSTSGLEAELTFPKIKGSPKQMWGEVLPVGKENWLLGRQLAVPDIKEHWPRRKMSKRSVLFLPLAD